MSWGERESSRDEWHERFVREILESDRYSNWKKDPNKCEYVETIGISNCSRPVVRSGYCILHASKLTEAEKSSLSPQELKDEIKFEEAFRDALSEDISNRRISFEGIHFSNIHWNQPPWSGFLKVNNLSFSLAVFHQNTNFSGVEFHANTNFRKTVFRGDVTLAMSRFTKGVQFEDAVFEKNAAFGGCKFDGQARFVNTRFFGKVSFMWAKFEDVWFKGVDGNLVFHSESDFRQLNLSGNLHMIFESVSLSKASFAYTHLEKVELRTVTWHRPRSRLPTRMGRRRMLWDEDALLRDSHNREDYDAVTENYSALVRRHENLRDFEAAEDFYIGEMEVRRLARGALLRHPALRHFRRLVNPLNIYNILSCYGSSYLQAFWVLVCLVVLFSIGFLFTGLSSASQSSVNKNIRYVLTPTGGIPPAYVLFKDLGISFAHTLGVLTFQRERSYMPSSTLSYVWQSFASIALTGQTALLLLAIRRRFKR